jgi:hypothetical protein
MALAPQCLTAACMRQQPPHTHTHKKHTCSLRQCACLGYALGLLLLLTLLLLLLYAPPDRTQQGHGLRQQGACERVRCWARWRRRQQLQQAGCGGVQHWVWCRRRSSDQAAHLAQLRCLYAPSKRCRRGC